jgi:hypothetical protein
LVILGLTLLNRIQAVNPLDGKGIDNPGGLPYIPFARKGGPIKIE